MTDIARLSPDLAVAVDAYRSCEFATVTRAGTPIAWPVIAVLQPDGTFFITTSIGLPNKAFHIRRNPLVALLFSDPTGSGLVDPPQILVQGSAACPDELVQIADRNPDYLARLFQRQPSARAYSSSALMRWLMDVYYMRLVITVTPHTVTPGPPLRTGTPLAGGAKRSDGIRREAAERLPDFGSAVLAALDPAGRPTLTRVRPELDADDDLVRFELADGDATGGPASLLFHRHDDQLWDLRSFVVTGVLERRDSAATLTLERFLPGADRIGPVGAIKSVRQLRSAARNYLDRRGWARPEIDWAAIEAVKSRTKRA